MAFSQAEWESNKEPLLGFLEEARSAARGRVTHQDGRPAEGATVVVSERAKDIVTSSRGEWWRMLMPGTYRVRAVLGDRRSKEVSLQVREGEVDGPRLDLKLVTGYEQFDKTPFLPSGRII